MSFIRTIEEASATDRLAEIYGKISGARGGVANVLKVHSLNPRVLAAHFELYKAIQFGKSPLSRPLREMMGVVVSAANRCSYCVAHHSEPLYAYGIDQELVQQLGEGQIPERGLAENERALLLFARTITVDHRRDEEAIETLRRVGWSDEAILDATTVASYFNFVNRLVETLGVGLEDDFESTCGPTLTGSQQSTTST